MKDCALLHVSTVNVVPINIGTFNEPDTHGAECPSKIKIQFKFMANVNNSKSHYYWKQSAVGNGKKMSINAWLNIILKRQSLFELH